MSLRLAGITFDRHHYDPRGDVLYLNVARYRAPAHTYATPEGHCVEYDEAWRVVAMILVNVRWLLDRDGELKITWPAAHVRRDELAETLRAEA